MYNNKFKNIVRYIEIKFESFFFRYLKIWYLKKVCDPWLREDIKFFIILDSEIIRQ